MTDDLIYSRTQDEFIDSVLQTVDQRDGTLLDELFNARRMSQVVDLDFDDDNDIDPDRAFGQDRQTLWTQLSQLHWATCRYLHFNDIERAFRYQSRKFACLMTILNSYQNRSNDDNVENENEDVSAWLLPLFNRHAHELRLLALMGNDEGNNDENEMSESTNSNSTIQKLNGQLIQTINVVQRFPSTSKIRKIGIFVIVNHMLKTYYTLNKFNLCTFFISRGKRKFENFEEKNKSSTFDRLAERPLKQYMEEESRQRDLRYSSYVLTYRYFVGRHLLLKHDYAGAIEHFDYVFTNSPENVSFKNKQQTLLYLVVLKMFFGFTPKIDILDKYQLYQLIELIEPVRHGALKTLMEKIREHQQFLIDTGLFFLIENFKLLTIRNLFRTYVFRIDQQQTDKIALESILLVILNFGLDDEDKFTLNELIDLLSNMIGKGMIRGYISYKFQTLVVSRKDPFPRQFRFTSLLKSV